MHRWSPELTRQKDAHFATQTTAAQAATQPHSPAITYLLGGSADFPARRASGALGCGAWRRRLFLGGARGGRLPLGPFFPLRLLALHQVGLGGLGAIQLLPQLPVEAVARPALSGIAAKGCNTRGGWQLLEWSPWHAKCRPAAARDRKRKNSDGHRQQAVAQCFATSSQQTRYQ